MPGTLQSTCDGGSSPARAVSPQCPNFYTSGDDPEERARVFSPLPTSSPPTGTTDAYNYLQMQNVNADFVVTICIPQNCPFEELSPNFSRLSTLYLFSN